MSPPTKSHFIKPNGLSLCNSLVVQDDWLRITSRTVFEQAISEGNPDLCVRCVRTFIGKHKTKPSAEHKPIIDWIKRRMLDVGLTRNDIAPRAWLHPWSVHNALNTTYEKPGAQTDTLAKIVAALGGELHVTYQVTLRRNLPPQHSADSGGEVEVAQGNQLVDVDPSLGPDNTVSSQPE
jgi:hypothetical protein